MKHFNVCTKVKLPYKLVTERVAFLGMSGTGKSYAATKTAEEMLEAGAQLNFIDPVGIGYGLRVGADGKKGGYPIYVFGGDHADIEMTSKMGAVVAETIVTSGISAVIDISDFTLGQQTEFLIEYAETLWQLKKKNRNPLHIFWEECHLFIPQERAPEPRAATLLNRIERLIRIGRQRGVGSSMISQFPQSVHKRCLNNAEVVFAFACSAKHERKAVSEWFDANTTSANLDVEKVLPGLETGTCVLASRRLLQCCEVVRVLPKRTFDSSDTPEFGGKNTTRNYKLAAVDKEKLSAALSSAFEEAKKNDPKLLREENERLKQLVKQHELGHFLDKHKLSIHKTHEELYLKWKKVHLDPLQEKYEALRNAKLKRINIQLVRETRKYEKACAQLDASVKVASKALGHMVGDINHLRGMESEYSQVKVGLAGMKPGAGANTPQPAPLPPNYFAKQTFDDGSLPPGCYTVRSNGAEVIKNGRVKSTLKERFDIAAGERSGATVTGTSTDFRLVGKMKDMLAALKSGSLSRDDLATVVGMAPGSGGFNNYYGALKTAGFIGAEGALTNEGYVQSNHLGGISRNLADVVARHGSAIVGKMKAMVETVAGCGVPVSRDQLADMVGMARGSGGFNNYVGALTSRGILTKSASGYIINPVLST